MREGDPKDDDDEEEEEEDMDEEMLQREILLLQAAAGGSSISSTRGSDASAMPRQESAHARQTRQGSGGSITTTADVFHVRAVNKALGNTSHSPVQAQGASVGQGYPSNGRHWTQANADEEEEDEDESLLAEDIALLQATAPSSIAPPPLPMAKLGRVASGRQQVHVGRAIRVSDDEDEESEEDLEADIALLLATAGGAPSPPALSAPQPGVNADEAAASEGGAAQLVAALKRCGWPADAGPACRAAALNFAYQVGMTKSLQMFSRACLFLSSVRTLPQRLHPLSFSHPSVNLLPTFPSLAGGY
jgi:hypothetical protein